MSDLTNFQMVHHFHNVFGYKNNTEIQYDILMDEKLIKFRIAMLTEEFNEFIVALKNNDFKECIDAICDLMYFTYGTFDIIGFNFDKAIQLGKNYKYLDYCFKTKNEKIFTEPKYKFDLDFHLSYILQNIEKLVFYLENKNIEYFVWHLNKIERTCQTLGTLFGVDINKCFSDVHNSNMTKVCLSEDEAKLTVEHYNKLYSEEKSTYKNIAYKQNYEYWIVYDSDTGKILKSINFKLPKFYFE